MRAFQVLKFCIIIAWYITWKVTKSQNNNFCSFLNLAKLILPYHFRWPIGRTSSKTLVYSISLYKKFDREILWTKVKLSIEVQDSSIEAIIEQGFVELYTQRLIEGNIVRQKLTRLRPHRQKLHRLRPEVCKGDQPKIPPVFENLAKSPLVAEQSSAKNFRVFYESKEMSI